MKKKEATLSNNDSDKKDSKTEISIWIAVGMIFGTSLGIAFNHLAVGISIGMLLGAGIGSYKMFTKEY